MYINALPNNAPDQGSPSPRYWSMACLEPGHTADAERPPMSRARLAFWPELHLLCPGPCYSHGKPVFHKTGPQHQKGWEPTF